jgi:23S rRNA pseudouridine1911/1915/1917 synthase
VIINIIYRKNFMAKEKAYKVLATQQNISNSKAKELIDKGLVFIADRKVVIARAEVDTATRFKVKELKRAEVLYEDDKIIALNKPANTKSEDVAKEFKDAVLLHRLDKDTTGVMLLVKDEDFRLEAIKEFKNERVYKEYEAIISGRPTEEFNIDMPIHTVKGKKAVSKISLTKGLPAHSEVTPLMISGKRTKVKVVISTGRTHQIRIHLSHAGYPIVGDLEYGGTASSKASRVMLHAKRIKLFDYDISAPDADDFKGFGL